jgi:hypothetical protein
MAKEIAKNKFRLGSFNDIDEKQLSILLKELENEE